jgi:hypothetical protein
LLNNQSSLKNKSLLCNALISKTLKKTAAYFFLYLILFSTVNSQEKLDLFFPFETESDLKNAVLHSKDTVLHKFEFYIFDTVNQKMLHDNTGFFSEVHISNQEVLISQYVVFEESLLKIATMTLSFDQNEYFWKREFVNTSNYLKSISEIKKLSLENKLNYLLIACLSGENKKFIRRFVKFQNTEISENPIPTYAFYRSYLEHEGFIRRMKSGNYKINNTLKSDKFTFSSKK